jgi:small subunit ribosomal protein S4
MFVLKNKNIVCRHYQLDLWGHVLLSKKKNRLLRVFLRYRREKRVWYPNLGLRLDIPRRLKRYRRQKLFGKRLDIRKKLCLFYGGLRKTYYRKLNKISDISTFPYGTLSLLELRLSSLVFRAHFAGTILESIQFVQRGWVMVNKKVIKRPSFIVKKGDIVELIPFKKSDGYYQFLEKCSSKHLLVCQYPYLEINYRVGSVYIINVPKAGEVPLSFKVPSGFTLSEYRGKN